MARKNIRDLKEGDLVNEQYSVKFKKPPNTYKSKAGKWFEFRVGDATGEISVKYWGRAGEDIDSIYNSFDKGDIVRIVGNVTKFNNQLSINVDSSSGGRIVKEEIYDIRHFIPTVEDVEWLSENYQHIENEFMEMVKSVKDEWMSRLLTAFFDDPEFWEDFRNAPASMKRHSAFVHGLMHHTLNVAKICDTIASRYPALDRDLAITGALLHDIGKMKEFMMTTNINMTEDGELMGHVFMGAEMVDEKCRSIDGFPELLRKKLVHIVLSHHGSLENGWGSAKDPALPEAVAVFLADHTDSQVFQYLKLKHEANTEDDWFYVRDLGHIFLK